MSPPQAVASGGIEVLVIGAGPAALALAAALGEQGVPVAALAVGDPAEPWANTYGIWGDEVDALGLGHLLEHRWSHTSAYFGPGSSDPGALENAETALSRDYGLFDKALLQQHWLERCQQAGVVWTRGMAVRLEWLDATGMAVDPAQPGARSCVHTADGQQLLARLVVDASGHAPVFLQRPDEGPVAGQAAYGIVGRFSAPPVQSGQFVLMDYRGDHLSSEERSGQPPTFLYAMDLGQGRFFVEETSLALAPPLPFELLKQRLVRRLEHRGVAIQAVEHEEFCLFPMNLPLPDPRQPLLGFGGAASMVHPASGYLVGALLRRAPGLATALAAALADPLASPRQLAACGWQALWPQELRRRHALYRFGLEKLMRFSEPQLRRFFLTFFALPPEQWSGFLANTLSLPELLAAMLRLFAGAPVGVRWGLLEPRGRELALLGRLLSP